MGKDCGRCATPDADFGPNRARKDGLQSYCRACMKEIRVAAGYDKERWATNREAESERNRQYRAANAEKLKPAGRARANARRASNPSAIRANNIRRKHGMRRAMPIWANRAAMNAVYAEARQLQDRDGVSRHVDHEIPLKHPNVCGLHVQGNLRVLTALENMAKHNAWRSDWM